jgi:hypothetical protein
MIFDRYVKQTGKSKILFNSTIKACPDLTVGQALIV